MSGLWPGTGTGALMSVLSALAEAIRSATVDVIDLTAPLSSSTPILQLPEPFGNTVPFTLHEISRYDERGPAWYWNWFSTGEHTGTHFAAPIHWVSGKDLPDHSVDRIAPRLFVGPACVLDITAEAAKNPDYLVDVRFIEDWESRNGMIPSQSWVLLRTGWSTRKSSVEYLNAD